MADITRVRIAFLRLIFAAVMVLSLFAGCGTHRSFELLEKNHPVKPGSLVVFSGTNNKLDTILAESVTQELQRRSAFRVVTQNEVAKGIPGYPYRFTQAAEEDEPAEYRASKALVEIAQRKLKTTYVFVVWTETLYKSTRMIGYVIPVSTYSTQVGGDVFEYPGGTLIGKALFQVKDNGTTLSAEGEEQNIEKMMEDAGKQMVDYFLDATHTKRPKAGEK